MCYVAQCSSAVSELQGTHIFLVVVSQGEFSLWQNELPLQKLCVFFPFFPQHPLVETWIQFKKPSESQVLQYTQVSLKMEILWLHGWRVTIWAVFTSWLFCYAKNWFFLHSSACVWGTTLFILVLHRQTDKDSSSTVDNELENSTNITCGIWKRWILGFSCEFHPFIFSTNPLLS